MSVENHPTRTYQFLVSVTVPDDPDARHDRVKAYVAEAVTAHGGCFRPDDPLFGLGDDAVQVKRYARPKYKSR